MENKDKPAKKEPKKIVISEYGDTIWVGEKEFATDDLDAAQIALIMKERAKGFVKVRQDKEGKIKAYSKASVALAWLGLGAYVFSFFFQNKEVLQYIVHIGSFLLSGSSIFMLSRRRAEKKELEEDFVDYQDDQLFLTNELAIRTVRGDNMDLAEDILKEAVEECGFDKE